MSRHIGPITTLLLVAACHSSTLPEVGELKLLVHPQVASDGTLSARFVNVSNTEVGVGYLECTTKVQRLDGDAWSPIPGRNGEQECILPLAIIRPGREYVYRTLAPEGPGTFRLVVTARIEGERPDLPGGGAVRITVASHPFDLSQ